MDIHAQMSMNQFFIYGKGENVDMLLMRKLLGVVGLGVSTLCPSTCGIGYGWRFDSSQLSGFNLVFVVSTIKPLDHLIRY